jgi:hypothetical protein
MLRRGFVLELGSGVEEDVIQRRNAESTEEAER